jgi:hypothetical protein
LQELQFHRESILNDKDDHYKFQTQKSALVLVEPCLVIIIVCYFERYDKEFFFYVALCIKPYR